MKTIALSRGKHAIVDDEDWKRLAGFSWACSVSGYAVTNRSGVNGFNYTGHMHRMVLGLPPGLPQVDHINRNKLDNRKANLRTCTHSQNGANTVARTKNTSGFKGVTFDKSRGKFRAQIQFNQRMYNLGRYETALEAAEAYNRTAIKCFGEFAQLNNVSTIKERQNCVQIEPNS